MSELSNVNNITPTGPGFETPVINSPTAMDEPKPQYLVQLVEAAEEYRTIHGLVVHPLHGKIVPYKQWQRRVIKSEHFPNFLTTLGEPGIGVQMGPTSGIIDVEFDYESEREFFYQLFDGDPAGPAFKSRRGEHHLFRFDPRLHQCGAGKKLKEGYVQLEFKIGGGDRGSQSVFPPTKERSWLPGRSLGEVALPRLPESVVERLLSTVRGGNNRTSKHSEPISANYSEPACTLTASQIAAVRDQVLSMNPATAGHSGDDQTFHVACEIRRRRAWGEVGLEILGAYNDHRCHPEWDPAKVERFWSQARKYVYPAWLDLDCIEAEPVGDPEDAVELGEKGEALPVPIVEVGRPLSAHEQLAEILRQKHSRNGEQEVGRLVGWEDVQYRRISSADLSQGDFNVDYLIPGALVQGQPLILAAPEKCMKTSILLDAAIALASGGKFLDHFKVASRRTVAVLSGESGVATIKETASRICQAYDLTLAELDNLVWYGDLPDFQSDKHLLAVNALIDEDQVDVLIIDPMYLCLDGVEAGNLMIQGQKLRPMAQLCEAKGVTLIVAHHTKSLGKDAHRSLNLSDISWAGFKQFFRQWWLINRREPYQEGSGNHRLWLSFGGSAGHSAAWAVDIEEGVRSNFDGPSDRHWNVNVIDTGEAKANAHDRRTEQDADRILKYLQSVAKADTKSGIRESADVKHPSRADRAIEMLLGQNLIEECEVKKRNNQTYGGFRAKVCDIG